MPAQTPIFVVLLPFLSNYIKRAIFPKQVVLTKKTLFHLPNTNIVLIFLYKTILENKRKTFFPPTTRTRLSWAFFAFILFLFVLFFCLSCPNLKTGKTKKYHFLFENLIVDILTFLYNTSLAPLHTICDFNIPQNTIKLGKLSKISWTRSWRNTWTRYRLKKNQNLDQILTLNIYIYIYIWPRPRFLPTF